MIVCHLGRCLAWLVERPPHVRGPGPVLVVSCLGVVRQGRKCSQNRHWVLVYVGLLSPLNGAFRENRAIVNVNCHVKMVYKKTIGQLAYNIYSTQQACNSCMTRDGNRTATNCL